MPKNNPAASPRRSSRLGRNYIGLAWDVPLILTVLKRDYNGGNYNPYKGAVTIGRNITRRSQKLQLNSPGMGDLTARTPEDLKLSAALGPKTAIDPMDPKHFLACNTLSCQPNSRLRSMTVAPSWPSSPCCRCFGMASTLGVSKGVSGCRITGAGSPENYRQVTLNQKP